MINEKLSSEFREFSKTKVETKSWLKFHPVLENVILTSG